MYNRSHGAIEERPPGHLTWPCHLMPSRAHPEGLQHVALPSCRLFSGCSSQFVNSRERSRSRPQSACTRADTLCCVLCDVCCVLSYQYLSSRRVPLCACTWTISDCVRVQLIDQLMNEENSYIMMM